METKIKISKKLKGFLKKKGVFMEFKKNCSIYSADTLYKKEIVIESVHSAFIWSLTPQGHTFWANIDDEFSGVQTSI